MQSRLESTQDSLSEEASCQMYQMWKVQENLRSECNVLELDCLVKEYICEVNDLSQSLVSNHDDDSLLNLFAVNSATDKTTVA